MTEWPPLRELAQRIDAYLKSWERAGALVLHNAGCYYMGGARLRITYVSRNGATTLSRSKAVAYLDWIAAGHVGRHTDHVLPNLVASTKLLDGPS